MVEFLREGLAEAPVALGLLIGFAIGTPFLIVAEIREHKRRKVWRAELNQISAESDAAPRRVGGRPCRMEGASQRTEGGRVSTFTARYSSRCAGCDERIHEGDLVTYGGTSVVHADCDDTQTETEKALVICPSCQLTQPCGCEDE